MSRFALERPVYFVEEPAFEGDTSPHLAPFQVAENLTVLVPHFPAETPYRNAAPVQQRLLSEFIDEEGVGSPLLWFYTPEALAFAAELPSAGIVYDCMDELSAFQDASPALPQLEAELLRRADIVFTGGWSLYEAKRHCHPNVHAFPSAVDVAHFAQARSPVLDPADQRDIPHPRIGFFGVVDERLDSDLLAEAARLRPDWHFVLVGPVVKIPRERLPQAANIHYLGRKSYTDLPAYIAGWELAMMPFARNAATRFISPTKTPEYLAAGKPVVSTAITDVVRNWGHLAMVRIADTGATFVGEAETALSLSQRDPSCLAATDRALEHVSWDRTWEQMAALTDAALRRQKLTSGGPKPLSAPGVARV
jgi:UDP-galactopyranose mutase